ncbi:Eco57I restriction-modification methylase domain-containing protein [Clostridium kluyveri]|uniref:site-specific DNA-methyltransferase (adenine-specific) n=1 Tax=Clostridium kluyveri (strain ATCC 8527 / DSM 555 / NBRC 12016 / NCIMB 10680 / K1) TaxID=431943 RepID=A5N220_CLOK5|nr:DNA methyltransferase [Clostridium kluyveri]EDK35166.1 Predicted DNA modification methyltransferase [Clostridium kluyveri DSM 555]
MNDFIESIKKIYNFMETPIPKEEKLEIIKNFKQQFNISEKEYFSQKYYELVSINKRAGIVYTQRELSYFMIKNLIEEKDVIYNPFVKIVDPACGCGNILSVCFFYLRHIFIKNIEVINNVNNINLKLENINSHIVCNNLFGFDIDEIALKILNIDLFSISGEFQKENFVLKDFLIDAIEKKFDIFIGNPPYIGHKSIEKKYSETLKRVYKNIYKDKSDVYYCFFEKSLKSLEKAGKAAFITPRYFCEACSGKQLREFLSTNTTIYKIVDFYGIRPFKGVGVDPIIIFFRNKKGLNNKIEIIKPDKSEKKGRNKFYDSLFLNKDKIRYKKFFIPQSSIDDNGWVFISEFEKNIINKIRQKCNFTLKDICESYQGIITGCDRAFIADRDTILKNKIELNIIKPWIKSSYIHKNSIDGDKKFIIYSNFIEYESQYPNSIEYIGQYKEKLIKRRECKRGTRKWYELQWGRKAEIFEDKKIIFPYKSQNNRFALDKGSYFSADIYSLVIKRNDLVDYNTLLNVLNSSIYEFYFKTFGKKLGCNLYEYYPSNLMKLYIPPIISSKSYNFQEQLYDYFQLTHKEIKFIENSINI